MYSKVLWNQSLYHYPHFEDGKTEAQKWEVSCLSSLAGLWKNYEYNPALLECPSNVLAAVPHL